MLVFDSLNRLPAQKRTLILRCLNEGMSIRGTARTAGCSKPTVLNLLVDAGWAALDLHNRWVRDLTCEKIQADEIWSFVHAKSATETQNPEAGTIWTWTAILRRDQIRPFLVGGMGSISSRLRGLHVRAGLPESSTNSTLLPIPPLPPLS